ncbi:hypothetical protein ZWY2020_018652 [Hordeum vulgare]|nr:hypothetical protein ZWY2020_018652 [Hordeum vulgare]
MLATVAHHGYFTFPDLENQHCCSRCLHMEVMAKEEEELLNKSLKKIHIYSKILFEKLEHQLWIWGRNRLIMVWRR